MMQDPVTASNFEALNTKSLEVRFDLAGTDYLALENIGTGAYGVVCSANLRSSGEHVAIKKIPDIFGQVTVARRTYREIKILRHFRHDNIISIRDILQPSDDKLKTYCDVYIVLDLMESDLHRIIYSPQQLTDEHVRFFLYQILRGLKYIHSANIVHRDLKPSNLLVNENCELKIGDFGMARGISASPDDHNIKMTQYVATRWYRAPELILLTLNYTAAIDMWSVGCILAEMIGRRHLFPGKDYRHQLELIFNVVGSPSDNYINMTSNIIGDFLRMFPKKEPADLRKLYPSANAKAIRLIGQMLKMEPGCRISAEDALNDAYLSRYHDPDDEPICVPAFDFSFEKQDMDANALRDAITKEIMDYRRPALLTSQTSYTLRPVTSDHSLSSDHNSEHCQPVTDSAVNTASSQSQSSSARVQVTTNSDDVSSPDVKAKPEVPGISTVKVEVDGNSVEMPSATTCRPTDLQPDDVIMLSARSISDGYVKLKEEFCQDASDRTVTTIVKDNQTDAAVIKDIWTDSSGPAVKDTRSDSNALVVNTDLPDAADAKARIKAALLNSGRRRQRLELSEISANSKLCRGVTALQRQREREEQRRLKRQRALERRKKKTNAKSTEADGPLLTDEDRTLLERWKSIYLQSSQTISPGDSHSTVSTSDLVDQHTSESSSPCLSGLPLTKRKVSQDVNHSLQGQVINSSFLSSQVEPSVQPSDSSLIETNGSSSCHLSALTPLVFSAVTFPALLPSTEVQSSIADLLAQTNPEVQHVKRSPVHLTSLNLSSNGHIREGSGFNEVMASRLPPSYSEALHALLPTTTPLFSSEDVSHGTVNARFLQQNQLCQSEVVPTGWTCESQSDAVPTGWICEEAQRTNDSKVGQVVGEICAPGDSDPVSSGSFARDTTSVSDDLHVITSRLMKSHVDDLTLHHTPRGSGAGYGVGCDEPFTAVLLSSELRTGQECPESAPLSSTLIDDWRFVTGDMDASDLEAALQEMGAPRISLTDLTSSRYLSP